MREILGTEVALAKPAPAFLRGALNEGFRVTFREGGGRGLFQAPPAATGLVVVTETEIFGRQRSRRPAPNARAGAARAQVDQLLDFAELVEGDFVVHLQHGIAHYRGITTLDTAQGPREVISLEFDDRVTLHVPLQESHLVSRYVGLSKVKIDTSALGLSFGGARVANLRGIGAGNVNVNLVGGGTAVLTSLSAGQIIEVGAQRILNTSTTATGIFALY